MELIREDKSSSFRCIFELLFYATIIATNFQNVIPIYKIPYGLGAMIMFNGFLGLILLLSSHTKLPLTFWFLILLNIAVAGSQFLSQGELPFIGVGTVDYFHWFSFFIAMYYLVQNENSAKRLLLYYLALIVFSVVVGGSLYVGDRLSLEEGIGNAFRNANRLAHMAALFSIIAIFYSFKARIFYKPAYWAGALLAIAIMLETVSRGGVLSFACGAIMLVCLVLSGKGMRLSGIFLVILVVFIGFMASAFLAEQLYNFSGRVAEDTGRTHVYSVDTLKQMFTENLVIGSGAGTFVRSVGFTAHNTYIYTFLCFGGFAATIYLIWLYILGIRIIRMLFSGELPLHTRMMVSTMFGMSLVAQILSNQGYLFYSSIYAQAMVEKFTSPYSKKNIRERKMFCDEEYNEEYNDSDCYGLNASV